MLKTETPDQSTDIEQGVDVGVVLRHDLLDIPADVAHLVQDEGEVDGLRGHCLVDGLPQLHGHVHSLQRKTQVALHQIKSRT